MRTGAFPQTILKKKTVKPVQEIEEAHKVESEAEPEVEAPEEAADLAGAFDDAFGSDSDEAPPAKKEAPPPR